MKMGEAVERFIDDRLLAGLAASSAHEYETQLRVWGRWLAGCDVSDTDALTSEHVRAYLSHRRRTVSQSTVCHDRAIIHLFVRFLIASGCISWDASAVPRVSSPKEDELRRIHLDDGQCAMLFNRLRQRWSDAAGEPLRAYLALRNLAVASLLFGAGLRISEVAAAKYRDLNINRRELVIPRSKCNRPRTVAVPGSAMAVLRFYLRARARMGIHAKPHTALLCSPNGTHYARSTLVRPLQAAARECGVELTSHAGRRYCITRLSRVDLFAAQQQAGHRRIETTRKYYKESTDHLHSVVRANDPLRKVM